MMPKKGRREITVDGVLYHYKITGCISLVIRNSVTGEIIKINQDWKPKWKLEWKPSDTEQYIRNYNNKNNE